MMARWIQQRVLELRGTRPDVQLPEHYAAHFTKMLQMEGHRLRYPTAMQGP